MAQAPRVVVIGGGVTGLRACLELRRQLGPDAHIELLESRGRLGGKIKQVDFPGGPVEVGAEAFVWRRGEVKELIGELGLDDEIVHPSGKPTMLRVGGHLHSMPERAVMGLPTDPETVRGLVSDATVDVIASEPERPLTWQPGQDIGVGVLVAERFGAETVAATVDPMLGGVYAAASETVSLRSALPAVAAALDDGAESLTEALRRSRPEASDFAARTRPGVAREPIFGALRGGYRTLLTAMLEASDAVVQRHTPAEVIGWDSAGYFIDPVCQADAIVVATPAPVSAALLSHVAPRAAARLRSIPLANSAVVTMHFGEDTVLPGYSGILLGSEERDVAAKAFTLSSVKWPHVAARHGSLVRASFGRWGDDSAVKDTDQRLIRRAWQDFAAVTETDRKPRRAYVQRWWGGLPQHQPGHEELVSDVREALSEVPRVAVAGAYLDGVGVASCLASAVRAVDEVVADL